MLAASAWLAWLMAGKLDEAGGLRVGLLLVLTLLPFELSRRISHRAGNRVATENAE